MYFRRQLQITCCIIDEATQCTELESLMPTQLGIEKFVLVGDHKQLNATVQNKVSLKLNNFARGNNKYLYSF